MPSRRISANLNLAPVQEIAVNPYSSFNSDNVNMLTRIVTGGKNKDFVVAGLDVTGVNTISETLGANILTEHFTSGITGWTGSNVVWTSSGIVTASIPSPLVSINATLTYNTLINSSYIGQYIKVQFTTTNVPKNLFVTVGNETKSYDHPAAGSYTCYLQLSNNGPSPLSLIFTFQLDSLDIYSNATVQLNIVTVDPVINLGIDINPITLPTVSTPDLYAGTNLDSTNIPLNMLHPHYIAHVTPGVCIKDETTLSFTGTNPTVPILTLDYSNANNWIGGIPFGVSDFYSPTATYYSVDGGSPISTTFDGSGNVVIPPPGLQDDGSTPHVVKIVGNTVGPDSAFVKWAYLVVYYSYFKNPIPNNAYIGLATEAEISDARYGEDYLILAKLRFVDAVTVDAIIYYPDRKDLAFNDATRITYNNITQLKYWDNKPLNVSQALDELAYKLSNVGGGGGSAGGGTGEFNIRWGKNITVLVYPDTDPAHGWDLSNTGTNAPFVTPSTFSANEWSAAYTANASIWKWCTISWATDHWVATTGASSPPGTDLNLAIAAWDSLKAYVVFRNNDSVGHPLEFRIVNPTNPPGDNYVRGPLTSETLETSSQLFLTADGSWKPFPTASDHSTMILQDYTAFKTWVTTQLVSPDDYGRMIFITYDNTWWRAPILGEATLSNTWGGSATINNVPSIFKPINHEFEVNWGSTWPSPTAPVSWIWSSILWNTSTLKWSATPVGGNPYQSKAAASAAFPQYAYVVYNVHDPLSCKIINPYNPMGNGLVRGPTVTEVQESSTTLYLAADGTWKSVATQDAAANGDFYKDNLNGSTSSNIVLTPVNNTFGLNNVPTSFIDGMAMRFIASMSNTVIYDHFIVSSVSGIGYNGPTADLIFEEQSNTAYNSTDTIWTVTSANSGPNTIWTMVDINATNTYHFTLTISGNNQPIPSTAVFIASSGGIGTFTLIPSNIAVGITTVDVWNPTTSLLLGAKTLVKNGVGANSTPVTANDIQAGQIYELTYSADKNEIAIAQGLLKSTGINVLYADFDNNSGVLDLSNYNLNPADQSVFQVIPNQQIPSLSENHVNVSSSMLTTPIAPSDPVGISNPAQLFQGNGAGVTMWRQYKMNDNTATISIVNNGDTRVGSGSYINSNGVSIRNASVMQTKSTGYEPNYALKFNDTGYHYIDVGTVNNSDPLIPSVLTISCWINYKTNGYQLTIYGRSNNSAYNYFNLGIDASGNLVQILANNNTATPSTHSFILATASKFNSHAWNHIAVTYNTSRPNYMIAYVNGVAQTPITTLSISSITYGYSYGYGTITSQVRASIAKLGGYHSTGASYYKGRLSEFRLYSSVLSAPQITSIYTNSSPPITNLVRYFKLNEDNLNNSIYDWSSGSAVLSAYLKTHLSSATNNTGDTTSNTSSLFVNLYISSSGSFLFNGTSDTIKLDNETINNGTSTDINGASVFTYTFWLVDAGFDGTTRTIISRRENTTSYAWHVYIDTNGNLTCLVLDHSPSSVIIPASKMFNGMHIALVCNQKTITPYINGVKQTSVTIPYVCNWPATATTDDNGTQSVYIGSHRSIDYFSGVLEDFRIYSKNLTASDIQYISNQSKVDNYYSTTPTNVLIPATNPDGAFTNPTNPTDYYSATNARMSISSGANCYVVFVQSTLVDNIIFRNKYATFGTLYDDGTGLRHFATNAWTVSSYTLSTDVVPHQTLVLTGTSVQNIGSLSFDSTPVQKLQFSYGGTTGCLDNISILSFNRSNELYVNLDGATNKSLLSTDGSTEYLDLIPTDQIINMQYNSNTDSFQMLNPKPDLVVNNTTLVRGATHVGSANELNCQTSTGTDTTSKWSDFKTNYDFFNMLTDPTSVVTYHNTGSITTVPALTNYWWRLLPYNIPYGTKKIILRINSSYYTSLAYNYAVVYTIDFINSLLTTEWNISDNSDPGLDIFIDQIVPTNFNNISHTFDDVNTFTSTIKFDSNFIYSLAISTNSSLWIHKLTITSYR